MGGFSDAPKPLWAVPTLGGSPIRLADIEGGEGAWSPDGQRLVYSVGNSLYMADADGTAPHRLVNLPGVLAMGANLVTAPVWSPNGREIALTLTDPKTRISHLWEVSADGANLHEMFPDWHEATGECCGTWMPDGQYFVFVSQGQIWARREAGSFLYKVSREPVQLTAGTVSYRYPVPGRDGKTLFAVAGLRRGELERYDAAAKTFESFLAACRRRTSPSPKTGSGSPTFLSPRERSGAANWTERKSSSSAHPRFMPCCPSGRWTGRKLCFTTGNRANSSVFMRSRRRVARRKN